MDFSKEIFKGIKNILKQLHISLWDFLLLVDLTILFFAKNYKKSISFTINKTFLFKTYNFLYSWPLVTALMVIFILILLISITPEVSKFFGILEYPDNILYMPLIIKQNYLIILRIQLKVAKSQNLHSKLIILIL